MSNKRSKIYQMDDTLRLLFAFYSCISNNPNWILESNFTKKNRRIFKELFAMDDLLDYYFVLNDNFYGLTVEKIGEDIISCQVEEHPTFYDLSSEHLSMQFSYHIPSKSIVTLNPVEKVINKIEKQYKKVA